MFITLDILSCCMLIDILIEQLENKELPKFKEYSKVKLLNDNTLVLSNESEEIIIHLRKEGAKVIEDIKFKELVNLSHKGKRIIIFFKNPETIFEERDFSLSRLKEMLNETIEKAINKFEADDIWDDQLKEASREEIEIYGWDPSTKELLQKKVDDRGVWNYFHYKPSEI